MGTKGDNKIGSRSQQRGMYTLWMVVGKRDELRFVKAKTEIVRETHIQE